MERNVRNLSKINLCWRCILIIVTLGSQKFQFNRILKEIDRLIDSNEITEEVFAQIGYSDYIPQNYKYQKFLDQDVMKDMIKDSDIVITHGGTGAIISALKNEKRIIAIPRLKVFGEHVDDHQLQIVETFSNANYLLGVEHIHDLQNIIFLCKTKKFDKFVSNNEIFVNALKNTIEKF